MEQHSVYPLRVARDFAARNVARAWHHATGGSERSAKWLAGKYFHRAGEFFGRKPFAEIAMLEKANEYSHRKNLEIKMILSSAYEKGAEQMEKEKRYLEAAHLLWKMEEKRHVIQGHACPDYSNRQKRGELEIAEATAREKSGRKTGAFLKKFGIENAFLMKLLGLDNMEQDMLDMLVSAARFHAEGGLEKAVYNEHGLYDLAPVKKVNDLWMLVHSQIKSVGGSEFYLGIMEAADKCVQEARRISWHAQARGERERAHN